MCCLWLASFFYIFLNLCIIYLSFKNFFVLYLFIHSSFIYFAIGYIFIYLFNKLLCSNMPGSTPIRVLKGEMYAHSVQKSRFSLKTEEKSCNTAL